MMRDDMRAWLDARDSHLQQAQVAVDELSEKVAALREELLGKAERLSKAAEMLAWAARTAKNAPQRHALPEAAALSESLKGLLFEEEFPPET